MKEAAPQEDQGRKVDGEGVGGAARNTFSYTQVPPSRLLIG